MRKPGDCDGLDGVLGGGVRVSGEVTGDREGELGGDSGGEAVLEPLVGSTGNRLISESGD